MRPSTRVIGAPLSPQGDHGLDGKEIGERPSVLEEEGEVRIHAAPAAQEVPESGRGEGKERGFPAATLGRWRILYTTSSGLMLLAQQAADQCTLTGLALSHPVSVICQARLRLSNEISVWDIGPSTLLYHHIIFICTE